MVPLWHLIWTLWLDGALSWCCSSSCQSTPEQRFFLLKYQFSQVAWLSHWFAISLSHRQTSFQARCKCVFQSPAGRSARLPLPAHRLSRSWQCCFPCRLTRLESCTGAFGQTDAKPHPHCKHKVYASSESWSVCPQVPGPSPRHPSAFPSMLPL